MQTASEPRAAKKFLVRHSVRVLASAVLLAAPLAVATWYDLALGCFGLLLACCYLGSLYLLLPTRLILAAASALLAGLPWLGFGRLRWASTRDGIPHIEVPRFLDQFLVPVNYFAAEAPLRTFIRLVAEARGTCAASTS